MRACTLNTDLHLFCMFWPIKLFISNPTLFMGHLSINPANTEFPAQASRYCDSTTAVAREQICGHVASLEKSEHAIMGESFLMRFVRGLHIEDL
jgi:hypothetical protein